MTRILFIMLLKALRLYAIQWLWRNSLRTINEDFGMEHKVLKTHANRLPVLLMTLHSTLLIGSSFLEGHTVQVRTTPRDVIPWTSAPRSPTSVSLYKRGKMEI